jgi:hypothetical protein
MAAARLSARVSWTGTFVPGLWISSLVFFLVNIWILSIIISDVGESKSVMQRFNKQKANVERQK